MADLVVMPYEWHKYLGRGSGIAYQAMASGVPCVAPRGATFTRSLQRIGSASLFGSLTEGAIFAAILAARQNFAALAEAAYAGALDWRREHGLAKFVDAMIGVSHGAAARASRR
jgi:glycosyltransferase involved in cell wall biosynthesis